MKNCCAGHDLVVFGVDRCPVCATIDRLDKENLRLTVQLEEKIEFIKHLQTTLWGAPENPKAIDWNGGAC